MTPLVLVHGFMGGSGQWQQQSSLGGTRDLICVDLPGFGRNAHLPPFNRIEGYAAWVLSYLDDMGIGQFDLLGHSMGGMIVQEMVRLAPGRIGSLILYGTGAVGILPGRFETIETSIRRARTDGAAATARRISATWFLDQEDSPAFPACSAIAECSSLDAIIAGLEAMQAWSGLDHLPYITSRTLVLWGDRDRTYPWTQPETLWKTIAGSSLAVVPGCAHAVHMEKPALFNQIVGNFLGGQVPRLQLLGPVK